MAVFFGVDGEVGIFFCRDVTDFLFDGKVCFCDGGIVAFLFYFEVGFVEIVAAEDVRFVSAVEEKL